MAASPAFQFYASDWAHSVSAMTLEERGAYITLIAWSWEHGAVPNDMKRLATILGTHIAAARRVCTEVLKRWHLNDQGQWINRRLERTRVEAEQYRERQAAKGRASGRSRSNPSGTTVGTAVDSRFAKTRQKSEPDMEPETNPPTPISDLQDQEPVDQDPRADARRVQFEFTTVAEVKQHLKAAAHAQLDANPESADSEIAQAVKDAAAACKAVDYAGREVTKIIDAVRGERARRRA